MAEIMEERFSLGQKLGWASGSIGRETLDMMHKQAACKSTIDAA